jgi:hypothetical protein
LEVSLKQLKELMQEKDESSISLTNKANELEKQIEKVVNRSIYSLLVVFTSQYRPPPPLPHNLFHLFTNFCYYYYYYYYYLLCLKLQREMKERGNLAREVISKKDAEIEELRRGASFTPLENLIGDGEEEDDDKAISSNNNSESQQQLAQRSASLSSALDEHTSNAILAQARHQASRDGMSTQLKNQLSELKVKLQQQEDIVKEKEAQAKVTFICGLSM